MQKAEGITRIFRRIENVSKNVGAVMLFVLMVLGTLDVIGRSVFSRPILGAAEISKILVMGLVVLSWAFTQSNKGHIAVKYAVQRFAPRIRSIANLVTLILSLALFALIVWQAIAVGLVTLEEQKVFAIINIPVAVLHFIVSLGAFFICIELIIQIFESLFMSKVND